MRETQSHSLCPGCSQIQIIQAHLEQLEAAMAAERRRGWRWRLAAGAALLTLGLAGWVRPRRPASPSRLLRPAGRVITARAFVVTDPAGRVRARLGMNPRSGNCYLRLYSPHGKLMAEVADWPGLGPALRLLDVHRTPRVDLSYLQGVGSSLEMFDPRGKFRVSLREQGDDLASLQLRDGAGRALLAGNVTAHLSPTGPARRLPTDSLLLYGAHGRLRWRAP